MMKSITLLICSYLLLASVVYANSDNYNSQEIEEDGTRAVLKHIETEKFTSTISSWFRGLPRYNIHFRRISNDWLPEDSEYYESLGVIALPFAVSVVLSFFGAIIAVIIKCCCLCSKKKKYQVYKKKWALYSKVKIIVISVIICAPIALCAVATFSVHFSFLNALDTFSTTVNEKLSDVDSIEQILDEFNDTKTIQFRNEMSAIISQSNFTMDSAMQYEEEGRKYELIRQIVTLSVCGLAIIIPFVGLLAVCCSSKPTSFSMSVCVLFFIPVLWILITVYVPAGTFVADMCPQLESFLANQTRDDKAQGYISYYLECQNPALNPLINATGLVQVEIGKAEWDLSYARNHSLGPDVEEPIIALISELKQLQSKIDDLSSCIETAENWAQIKIYICTDVLDGFALIILSIGFAAFVFPILGHCGFELYQRLRTRRQSEYDELEEHEEEYGSKGYTSEKTVLLSSFRNDTSSLDSQQPSYSSYDYSRNTYDPMSPQKSGVWNHTIRTHQDEFD